MSSPTQTNDTTFNVVISRVFDAPVEQVWNAWVEPEQVQQWWGPQDFTCPSAQMDFRVGGTSLVCERAPQEHGGQDMYSAWTYREIVSHQRIEYIQNLVNEKGNAIEPTQVGLPPDYPAEVRYVITFQNLGNGQTEMTVTEYGLPSEHWHDLSKQCLEQYLDKMAAIFTGN